MHYLCIDSGLDHVLCQALLEHTGLVKSFVVNSGYCFVNHFLVGLEMVNCILPSVKSSSYVTN